MTCPERHYRVVVVVYVWPAGTLEQVNGWVVSPGHLQDGIFEMPGGQSGDPLSVHYRDQHQAWVKGLPTPLLPGPVHQTITFSTKVKKIGKHINAYRLHPKG